MDQEAMSALGICLGSQGIFEMVSDRMQLMQWQCADSPRAHIVTNYWNLATFTVFLQAEIVGMVGMEHDGKHTNALLRKHVAQSWGEEIPTFGALLCFRQIHTTTCTFRDRMQGWIDGVSMDAWVSWFAFLVFLAGICTMFWRWYQLPHTFETQLRATFRFTWWCSGMGRRNATVNPFGWYKQERAELLS